MAGILDHHPADVGLRALHQQQPRKAFPHRLALVGIERCHCHLSRYIRGNIKFPTIIVW
jgi:hypothetical protein